MAWRPLHPHHAIERVKVSLFFTEAAPTMVLSKAAEMFEGRKADLGFGVQTPMQGAMLSFQVSPGQMQPIAMPSQLSGWQFARLSSDGRPLETVQLNGSELTYEVSEYGGWTAFVERLRKVFGSIPEYLGTILSRGVTVLEYADRFIFEGDPSSADVRGLLSNIVDQLPDEAASGRTLWHVHRGWFTKVGTDNVLVNINLSTQDGQLAEGALLRSLETLTRVELRHPAGIGSVDVLYENFEALHGVANSTLGSSISADARKLIGMEKSS